jgi:hypothetical protein
MDEPNQVCADLWTTADADGNGSMTRDEDKQGFIEKANAENARS